MKPFPLQKSTLAILAILIPLLALFVYVALRSGPLAPVPVILTTVEDKAISPALFGIGTVEARYTYKIGPTFSGRLQRLDVQVGDQVKAGQLLGDMDPVDLDQRIRAQDAARQRAKAQLEEAKARHSYARKEAQRYQELLAARSTSEEVASAKEQELQITAAGLQAAQEELSRATAEGRALVAQRTNLQLVAPVAGLVAARHADPGTTLVAGQAVVEIIDPLTLWVNVRIDQTQAQGLAADLPAQIVLRSQRGTSRAGRVLRIEPLADVVTEEMLAKVVFTELPEPLPPVGELAEVTIALPPLAPGPVLPNAAIQRRQGSLGVWQVIKGELHFSKVTLGTADLDGLVQVREGVQTGDQVILYSTNALHDRSRIDVVEELPGIEP